MRKFNQKIFFSYTIRVGFISKELLKKFKENLYTIGIQNTFIDLIDNLENVNPQKKIYKEIKNSAFICIIDTPKVFTSPWVITEIILAIKYFKPLVIIKYSSFINICNYS